MLAYLIKTYNIGPIRLQQLCNDNYQGLQEKKMQGGTILTRGSGDMMRLL